MWNFTQHLNSKQINYNSLTPSLLHYIGKWQIMLFQPRQSPFLAFKCRSQLAESERVHWEEWMAPSSPDLNSLDYHVWGAILESSINSSQRLIKRLMSSWLLCGPSGKSCHKAVANFTKCLSADVAVAASDHHWQLQPHRHIGTRL